MGCDIHTYVEYLAHTGDNGEYWGCLISNGGSRDYSMFGILAGVRSGRCHIAPRGLPEGALSYEAHGAAYLKITDNPDQEAWDGYCSRKHAESWNEPIVEHKGREYVSAPDWHSHSWLTATELAECLAKYMFEVRGNYAVEWDATLAAMQALEDRGYRTRIVFWFDN